MGEHDDSELEEVTYSNTNHFYNSLAKLWNTVIHANLNGDIKRSYNSLWELFKSLPFIGKTFDDPERLEYKKQFKIAENHINLYEHHYYTIVVEKKAQYHYYQAKKNIDELQEKLFFTMKQYNLLVRTQEKGMSIYN